MPADMMDKQGFDLSQGIWRDSGWQEVEDLRRKLESLKELRELVRALGRAGGKGPLRRAPEEVRAQGSGSAGPVTPLWLMVSLRWMCENHSVPAGRGRCGGRPRRCSSAQSLIVL